MPTSKLFLFAFLLAYASSQRLHAQESKGFSIQTFLPIVLDAGDPSMPTQRVNLRLRPIGDNSLTEFEMAEVRMDQRAADFARAFQFGKAIKSPGQILVPLDIDLRRLPFAGTYVAKVRAFPDGYAQVQAAEFEISLKRPAAQIAPFEEITLQRNYITGTIEPSVVYLTETSNLAYANFASPLVSSQLHGPGGETLGTELLLGIAGDLKSGQRLAAQLTINGDVPLGTSTGTLRIESPQIASAVDLKFKIVNRFSLAWLLFTIVVFIGLGFLFRKLLEDRQTLDEALLEAQRAYAQLTDAAVGQPEEELKRRIEEAIAPLASAIRHSDGPDALRAAASKAAIAVDAELKSAAESRQTSRTKIATLKTSLGAPQGHWPEVATLIADAQQRLDRFLRDLDRGLVQSVATHIADLESELKTTLQTAFDEMKASVKRGVAQIGPWQGTDLKAAVEALTESLTDQHPITEIDQIVATSAGLARSARLFFTATFRVEALKEADGLMQIMALPASDPTLLPIASARARLVDSETVARDTPPYEGAVHDVKVLYDALIGAIRRKAPNSARAAVNSALESGDLASAAKAIADARASKPQVETFDSTSHTDAGTVVTVFPVPSDPLQPAATLRIIGPRSARVGQAVELNALLEHLPGQAAFNWVVIEGLTGGEQRDGARFAFSPCHLGTILVSCDVSIPLVQGKLSEEFTIEIAPSVADLIVLATKRRIGQREVIMSLISGLFIAGAGTTIFSSTFVGTWQDFLFAAIWGFTSDVGIGRLRSLAQPISSRQMPGLAPSSSATRAS